MWGSSFAELAKKAQEASEMASKKAQEASEMASNNFSSLNTTDVTAVASMFNLDSMIQSTGSEGSEKVGKDETQMKLDSLSKPFNGSTSQGAPSNEMEEDEENMSGQKVELTISSQTMAQTSSESIVKEASGNEWDFDDDDNNDLDIVEDENQPIKLSGATTENSAQETDDKADVDNDHFIDTSGKTSTEMMNADKGSQEAEVRGPLNSTEGNIEGMIDQTDVELSEAQTAKQEGRMKMNDVSENGNALEKNEVAERAQVSNNGLDLLAEADINKVDNEISEIVRSESVREEKNQTKEIIDVPIARDPNDEANSSSGDEGVVTSLSETDEIVPCRNGDIDSYGYEVNASSGMSSTHDVAVDDDDICCDQVGEAQKTVTDIGCNASKVEVGEEITVSISEQVYDSSISICSEQHEVEEDKETSGMKQEATSISSLDLGNTKFIGKRNDGQETFDTILMETSKDSRTLSGEEKDKYESTTETNEIIQSESVSIVANSEEILDSGILDLDDKTGQETELTLNSCTKQCSSEHINDETLINFGSIDQTEEDSDGEKQSMPHFEDSCHTETTLDTKEKSPCNENGNGGCIRIDSQEEVESDGGNPTINHLENYCEAEVSSDKQEMETDGSDDDYSHGDLDQMYDDSDVEIEDIGEDEIHEQTEDIQEGGDEKNESSQQREQQEDERGEDNKQTGGNEENNQVQQRENAQQKHDDENKEELNKNPLGIFSQYFVPKPSVEEQDDKEENHLIEEIAKDQNPREDLIDTNPLESIPPYAIEKFMSQLERLHSEHESEMKSTVVKHQYEMEELKFKYEEDLALAKKSQRGSSSDVASQDKFLAQLRQLEKEFNIQLKEKDEHLGEVTSKKNVMESQIGGLKDEVDALNQSLNARNGRLTELENEAQVNESLKSELEACQEAFTMLKARTKVVATELKDRRVECRTLNVSVQDLSLSKSSLEAERNDLELKASRLGKTTYEQSEQIEILSKKVSDLESELSKREKELTEKGHLGDKALNAYKKKAQASLANANARAAASNQAREDAEIDVANAMAEAENASAIAKAAEAEKEAAVLRATSHLQQYVDEIDELKLDRARVQKTLTSSKDLTEKLRQDAEELSKARDSILEEWNEKDRELEVEREKRSSIEQELALAKINNKALLDESKQLREDMENCASVAFMAQNSNFKEQAINPVSSTSNSGNGMSESDATIMMVRQELNEANDAIKNLKEELSSVLSQNPSLSSSPKMNSNTEWSSNGHSNGNSFSNQESSHNATPLFFAFEKQAELNTARDEITRLAALLGDAEADKSEAHDKMVDMHTKMEKAQAQLRRYEKLGPASVNTSSQYPIYGNGNWKNSHVVTGRETRALASHNDSTVNLEYLKNIMLRYLNAGSLNEKKTLIPVIAAVLELTPDEVSKASINIEKSAGIGGVSTSLIENVQNKGFVGGFFG